jgi:hypothetical protein
MLFTPAYYQNPPVTVATAVASFNHALKCGKGWAQAESTRLGILQPALGTLVHARRVSDLCGWWLRHPTKIPLVALTKAAGYQQIAAGTGPLTARHFVALDILIPACQLPSLLHERALALVVAVELARLRAGGVTLRRAQCPTCEAPLVTRCASRKTYCCRKCAVLASVRAHRAKKQRGC